MKEDILKFRKLCYILIKDRGYTKDKITIEATLAWPTFQKILVTPIDELHIHSSNLGKVQDFIKKHIDAFTYEGIKSDPETIKQNKEHSKPKKDNAIPIADVIIEKKVRGRGKTLYSKNQLLIREKTLYERLFLSINFGFF
jgi:hypothetical protein